MGSFTKYIYFDTSNISRRQDSFEGKANNSSLISLMLNVGVYLVSLQDKEIYLPKRLVSLQILQFNEGSLYSVSRSYMSVKGV
jgi:hypothetical protein